MEPEKNNGLSYFDRALGNLHGLPDVISTRPAPLRVVPPFGIGSHLYSIQTFRQRDEGDYIFLEHVSDNGTERLVIPPAVADAIARQRDQLTAKSRSRAGKRRAEEMKERGIAPGFMRRKKK